MFVLEPQCAALLPNIAGPAVIVQCPATGALSTLLLLAISHNNMLKLCRVHTLRQPRYVALNKAYHCRFSPKLACSPQSTATHDFRQMTT